MPPSRPPISPPIIVPTNAPPKSIPMGSVLFALPPKQLRSHLHDVERVVQGIVFHPRQRVDGLHLLGGGNRLAPRSAAVGAFDDAGLGEHEKMLGALAEDGAEAPVLHVADYLPRFPLIAGGNEAAVDEPI